MTGNKKLEEDTHLVSLIKHMSATYSRLIDLQDRLDKIQSNIHTSPLEVKARTEEGEVYTTEIDKLDTFLNNFDDRIEPMCYVCNDLKNILDVTKDDVGAVSKE